tara:strand:- start:282 stop:419 length:138 start_codon:yes stop_codon:yes gene_type:complete
MLDLNKKSYRIAAVKITPTVLLKYEELNVKNFEIKPHKKICIDGQ